MCSISGYGQTGPSAQRPAYAPVVQAESGFEQVYLQYQPSLDRPLNMGPPVADTTASLQALGAINGALFYRQRTGQGQHVDIAMFDVILNTFPKEFQQQYWPSTPDRLYGPFDTQDGFILVLPLNQKHFESLAACMERQDLLSDPRFATTTERLANYQAFTAILADWLRRVPSTEALEILDAAHIPCAKYRSVGEAADDPQLLHRGNDRGDGRRRRQAACAQLALPVFTHAGRRAIPGCHCGTTQPRDSQYGAGVFKRVY